MRASPEKYALPEVETFRTSADSRKQLKLRKTFGGPLLILVPPVVLAENSKKETTVRLRERFFDNARTNPILASSGTLPSHSVPPAFVSRTLLKETEPPSTAGMPLVTSDNSLRLQLKAAVLRALCHPLFAYLGDRDQRYKAIQHTSKLIRCRLSGFTTTRGILVGGLCSGALHEMDCRPRRSLFGRMIGRRDVLQHLAGSG